MTISNVIPFPKTPKPHPATVLQPAVPGNEEAIKRIAESFLSKATTMHSGGESGIDIYYGIVRALAKLIYRPEDSLDVNDARFAQHYDHMIEARTSIIEGQVGPS